MRQRKVFTTEPYGGPRSATGAGAHAAVSATFGAHRVSLGQAPARWDRHDSCGPPWPSSCLRGESFARPHAVTGGRRDPRRFKFCRGRASLHAAPSYIWRNETTARHANRSPRPSSLIPCAAVLRTAKRDDGETPPARPCARFSLHAGRAPWHPTRSEARRLRDAATISARRREDRSIFEPYHLSTAASDQSASLPVWHRLQALGTPIFLVRNGSGVVKP